MTHVDKTYHNIVINEQNNTFYIEELKSKGDLHALSTLEKIRLIRDKKMEYVLPDFTKSSGPLPQVLNPSKFEEGVLEPLQKIAEEICSGYKEKINSLGWFKRYFGGNHLKKNVDILFKSIFSPSHLFNVKSKVIVNFTSKVAKNTDEVKPEEIPKSEEIPVFLPALAINKIFSFLPLSDVDKFASLNREGKKRVNSEILIRAEKFGYVGKDENEAKEYLKELYKEVKSVFKLFIWDYSTETMKQFFSFNDDEGVFSHPTVRAEESLEKIMQLNPMDLMGILRFAKVYSEDYKTLKKFFGSDAYLKAQAQQRDPSLPLDFYATNFGKDALERAIVYKDVGIVKLLLENGADPNAVALSEETPKEIQELILARREKINLVDQLSTAINNKNLDEVKRLLKLGVDPNAKGALHKAAKSGSTEIVNLLINHGAQINRLYEGKTALEHACGDKDRKPNIEVVQLLLEKGADPNIGLLLHNAARNNYVEVVALLIEFKADVNKLNGFRCSALHFACEMSDPPNIEIIKLLLEASANKNINQRNAQGMTPLHLICAAGNPNLDVIQLLLKKGADPNTSCYRFGESCTPLGSILNSFGSPAAIKLLIDKGARLVRKRSIELAFSLACGYKGNTPNLELIKYFLDKKINPNFDVDDNANTPLHIAVQNNATEIIELLLNNKAKIKRNWDSESPLYFACLNGNPEIIKILIEKGVRLDMLLLLRAVQSGSVESVELLLEKDKKLINKKYRGVTPLLTACFCPHKHYKQNPEMVKFLLEKGADPNVCDYDEKSPLQRNIEGNGSPEIFKLLVNHGAKIEQLSKQEKEKALLLACGYKNDKPNPTVVKILLNNGVDPRSFKIDELTPLEFAEKNKLTEIVDILKNYKK